MGKNYNVHNLKYSKLNPILQLLPIFVKLYKGQLFILSVIHILIS